MRDSKNAYCVYLLRSLADGQYYIGQTDDIARRLKEHSEGRVRSTRSRRPMELVGHVVFATRQEARFFEWDVKHHSDKKRRFIRSLTG